MRSNENSKHEKGIGCSLAKGWPVMWPIHAKAPIFDKTTLLQLSRHCSKKEKKNVV